MVKKYKVSLINEKVVVVDCDGITVQFSNNGFVKDGFAYVKHDKGSLQYILVPESEYKLFLNNLQKETELKPVKNTKKQKTISGK